MALVGCVSNTVEEKKDLCNFNSLDELAGTYVNLGNGKLNGQYVYYKPYLTNNDTPHHMHEFVQKIDVKKLDAWEK
jgi:hypothetical protein